MPKFDGSIYYNNNAHFKPFLNKKKSDGLNCFNKYSHITPGSRDNNDVVFISYEDLVLSDCLDIAPNSDMQYGPFDKYKDIFILRDPYNLFSSRAKHYDSGEAHRSDLCVHKRAELDKLVVLWKDMAIRILDPRDGETGIFYDRWFSSIDYRRTLCESLGVKFNDKGKDLISGWGGGSSFDRSSTPASKMKVLERKKGYEGYEFYCKLSEDEELNQLLEKINESIK
tara:strand:+ start:1195 stop:1872 length:678 start_codon:yes stop_codon:yes gene_type:complete